VILGAVLLVDAILPDPPPAAGEPDYLDLWARQQHRKILAER
jgi:hypothetical protein